MPWRGDDIIGDNIMPSCDPPPTAPEQAKQRFLAFWDARYPEAPPINHFFKACLPTRWARIHSLPDAKRYPDNAQEWAELMRRQDGVIAALIAEGTRLRIIVNFIEIDNPLFKKHDFENIGVFVDRVAETVYQSFQFEVEYKPGALDDILIMIATEQVRGFFIGPDCLISPYDGGVDLILQDEQTCMIFKQRFRDWLSLRADGL